MSEPADKPVLDPVTRIYLIALAQTVRNQVLPESMSPIVKHALRYVDTIDER